MVTAAVLWSVVSAASFAAVAGKVTGTTGASDVGNLFVGLAAMVAAVSAWWNSRKSNKALGPPNGRTVQEQLNDNEAVLTRIDLEHEYQSTRNHQMINALAPLSMLPRMLEMLVEVKADVKALREGEP